jgi:hypothetical protein
MGIGACPWDIVRRQKLSKRRKEGQEEGMKPGRGDGNKLEEMFQ